MLVSKAKGKEPKGEEGSPAGPMKTTEKVLNYKRMDAGVWANEALGELPRIGHHPADALSGRQIERAHGLQPTATRFLSYVG